MTRIVVTRRNPRTGRIERPWPNRDGLFDLGNPVHGALKHHERLAAKVETLGEVLDLVRQGFSLRMTDGDSPPALIIPASLEICEEEGEESSDLWSSTLPKAPFGKDEMLAELRVALLVQANQIAHAGRWDFDTDHAQRLRELILGANPQSTRGDPSPLANLDSLCRRVADMAYARWKLTFDGPFTIRELSLLADMKEPAVRNSLSKERIPSRMDT